MAPARPVGAGCSPLDEQLGLTSATLTPQALEGLVRLGTWVPFAQAAQLLAALTGVQVSEATARRQTEAAGAAYEVVQTDQAQQIQATMPLAPQGAAQQVFSADGAFVPLRHGEWGEVKTLVVGQVGTRQGKEVHTEELSYFSRLQAAERFAQLSLVETHRRGLERAEAVAAVIDGAEWLQGVVDYHRADAIRILDFPHAAQYISEIGQAVTSAGVSLAPTWLNEQLERLKQQGPAPVLLELQTLRAAHPALAEVAEKLAYLEKRESQMQYPSYQAAGWPIGSGIVESANKLVVQARLKGAGMHWERVHVNPMLALRNAVCNERWAEAWQAVTSTRQRQRAQKRQERAQRHLLQISWQILALLVRAHPPPLPLARAVAQPAAVEPPVARPARLPQRPAPTHPWRRPFSTRSRTCPSPLPAKP